MSMRFHTCKTYEIVYGAVAPTEMNDDLIRLAHIAENEGCGYVSDDENELEIDLDFIDDIIQGDDDVLELIKEQGINLTPQLVEELKAIYADADKRNDYARLCCF